MERDESKTTQHESFGIIKAHRIVGHSGFMFGSDAKLDSFIQIEITKNSSVEYDRVLGRRTYSSNKLEDSVIAIKMTPAQFAEFITTLNIGSGTPCTIEEIGGERIDQFKDEVQGRVDYEIEKLRKSLKSHRAQFNKAKEAILPLIDKLPKKRQEDILRIIENVAINVCSNTPFYLDTLTEVVEEVTATAKTEIASLIGMAQNIAALPQNKSNVDTSKLLPETPYDE
jgi:hypothetical protein